MLWLQRLATRARTLVLRGRTIREVDDELRFHVDREISENIARGMTPEAGPSSNGVRIGRFLLDARRRCPGWPNVPAD